MYFSFTTKNQYLPTLCPDLRYYLGTTYLGSYSRPCCGTVPSERVGGHAFNPLTHFWEQNL